MTDNALSKEAILRLSVGHLLVVWDVLANRWAGSSFMDVLPAHERRALWALQDLCESTLVSEGAVARPEGEWNRLMAAARALALTLPVEGLE